MSQQIVLARIVTFPQVRRAEAAMWKREGEPADIVKATEHATSANKLWREAYKGEWHVLVFPADEPDALQRARVTLLKSSAS